eukprot:6185766-Pleurochrysis_carterae.AAC.1
MSSRICFQSPSPCGSYATSLARLLPFAPVFSSFAPSCSFRAFILRSRLFLKPPRSSPSPPPFGKHVSNARARCLAWCCDPFPLPSHPLTVLGLPAWRFRPASESRHTRHAV